MALDHGIGVRIPASQPDFARRFKASFVYVHTYARLLSDLYVVEGLK